MTQSVLTFDSFMETANKFKPIGAMPIKIITSEYVEPYEKKQAVVNRTWKERLFTFPWRPFVKTKTVEIYDTNKPIFYMIYNSAMIVNPAVEGYFKKQIGAQ